MTIDFELHQQAYELAVLEGLTLDNVARRTGIPRSTITRWSVNEGWMADREEYRRALAERRRHHWLSTGRMGLRHRLDRNKKLQEAATLAVVFLSEETINEIIDKHNEGYVRDILDAVADEILKSDKRDPEEEASS